MSKKIILLLLIFAFSFMSVGYASINSVALNITGSIESQPQSGVFISSVVLVDSKNADVNNSQIISAYQTNLESNIHLSPETTDSYITYDITFHNNSTTNYYYTGSTYDERFYSNNDITYEEINIPIGDLLAAGKRKTYQIKFKYNTSTVPSQNNLESCINFNFKKGYSVTYENISVIDQPTYVLEGETLVTSLTLNDISAPIEVKLGGNILNSSAYIYNNYTVTLTNVTADVHIRQLKKYTITNMVKNGSFEEGLTNWMETGTEGSWHQVNISMHGSYGYYRIPSASQYNYIRQVISWISSHKYYYYGYAISSTTQRFTSDVTNKGGMFTVTTGPSSWTKGSVIYTPDFTGDNTISVNFQNSTDNIIVDGIGVIDLTLAFGSGNEPNKTWCDQNIGYFDGSITVYK